MIHCTINGEVGYPSTSDKIKLTYNNPYVQDSGEYSYDISFPMSIHQNAVLFKHINRFDVKKRMSSFDDCKIYADNRVQSLLLAIQPSNFKLLAANRVSSIILPSRNTSLTI